VRESEIQRKVERDINQRTRSSTSNPRHEARSLEVLNEALRLLEVGGVDTGQREALSELGDLITERLDLLVSDPALIRGGGNAHEVLEELRARLLLESERDLHSAVQELSDLLDVLLLHVTRGESRGSKTDTTRNLGGSIARDGVL